MHYWKLSRAISPVRPTTFIITLYTDGVLYFIGIISVRVWAGVVVRELSLSVFLPLNPFVPGPLPRSDFLVHDDCHRCGHNIHTHLAHLSPSIRSVQQKQEFNFRPRSNLHRARRQNIWGTRHVGRTGDLST